MESTVLRKSTSSFYEGNTYRHIEPRAFSHPHTILRWQCQKLQYLSVAERQPHSVSCDGEGRVCLAWRASCGRALAGCWRGCGQTGVCGNQKGPAQRVVYYGRAGLRDGSRRSDGVEREQSSSGHCCPASLGPQRDLIENRLWGRPQHPACGAHPRHKQYQAHRLRHPTFWSVDSHGKMSVGQRRDRTQPALGIDVFQSQHTWISLLGLRCERAGLSFLSARPKCKNGVTELFLKADLSLPFVLLLLDNI